MSIHVALALTTAGSIAVISLLGSIGIAWEHREEASAPWFIASAGLSVIWAAASTIGLHIDSAAIWSILDFVIWIGICVVPVTWLAFVLVYTGRRHRTRPQYLFILGIVPSVTIGVLSFEQVTGGELVRADLMLTVIDGQVLATVSVGTLGVTQVAYSFFLLGVALLLLLEQVFSSHDVYREQAGLLAIITIVPILVSVIRPLSLEPFNGGSITGFSFVVVGLGTLAALTQYNILQTRPVPFYLAHSTILESIDTPLIVANESNVIVHSNDAADAHLGDNSTLRSEEMTSLPGVSLDAEGDLSTDEMVEIETPAGRRIFDTELTTLEDDHGRRHGSVIWFQDLTGIRRREERLSVLNRVLRHDIRNEMNVILGHADAAIESNDSTESSLAAITSTAQSVVDLSETARDIERLITLAPAVEPAGSVEEALGDLRDRIATDTPQATLDTQIELDVATRVPVGFREVVWQLVENGVRHNPADAPMVTIDVERAPADQLRCVVTDKGPGIPKSELRVFDSGEETSLDHASGLGLWLVHWVVTEFGGSVAVESSKQGTSVSVTLPIP